VNKRGRKGRPPRQGDPITLSASPGERMRPWGGGEKNKMRKGGLPKEHAPHSAERGSLLRAPSFSPPKTGRKGKSSGTKNDNRRYPSLGKSKIEREVQSFAARAGPASKGARCLLEDCAGRRKKDRVGGQKTFEEASLVAGGDRSLH